ncbi:MAG: ThiF family adenylyltransferase [Muribaculaceae bacterium]|uniref:DUF6791 domain-containing protein n=1 Tax=uncultured Bacteroides sp. TaxID=162156 RepID=UPI0032202947
MSQQHTNLDPELQKLQAEGFELEVRDGLIIVHHVPYLNSKQEILDGKLIFCFTSNISTIGKPNDHTAYWEGNKPCCNDGSEVPSLINSYKGCWNGFQEVYYLSLYPDSLPNSRYPDYYTKIKTYYSTIAGHAFAYNANLANTVKYGTVKIVDDDIFVYQDTNSSRAGLLGATAKFQGKKVAIVGLGGTGGYLLDYLAKMPVDEIHLFDGDVFSQHNAFRAPGTASKEELDKSPSKVSYFYNQYSKMHKHIIAHECQIDDGNIESLFDMDVVFICVDSAKVRSFISRHLMDHNIQFVDSGLGLTLGTGSVGGQVRVTSFFGGTGEYIKDIFGTAEVKDDGVYATNIQIALLNSLAAIMMLNCWLKHINFFDALPQYQNVVYNVGMGKLFSQSYE